MVSFNCDGCGDVVKKPKLQQHYQRCYSSVTCLDCSTQFNSPNEFKAHNSCISEAEKYQKSVYKAPKKQQQPQQQQPQQAPKTSVAAPAPAAVEASNKRKRKEEAEAEAQAEKAKQAAEEKAAKKAKKQANKEEKKKKAKKANKEQKQEQEQEQEQEQSAPTAVDSRFDLSKLENGTGTSDDDEAVSDSEHQQDDPLEGEGKGQGGSESKVIKPLSAEELEAFKKRQRKLGIIYISRIPPGMTPAKVRHILGNFGEIARIYLHGGEGKRRSAHYTEGWVEFKSKKVAKAAAEMLNAQPIGALAASTTKKGATGIKSSKRFHDDVWTMKYLKGFKWHMLSEQMAQERASHTARLRTELSQSAFEQKDYLKKVERAKIQKYKEEKKKAKNPSLSAPTQAQAQGQGSAHYRTFQQKAPILKDVRDQRA